MDYSVSFGYWVRRWRKALDLTQTELAQRVGCALVTIKKIELDERRPSPEMAERLAVCLEIESREREQFLRMAEGEQASDQLPLPNAPIHLADEPPDDQESRPPTGPDNSDP